MRNDHTPIAVTHERLPFYLELARKTKRSLMITGSPGVGKTSSINAYAKENEMPVYPVHLGQVDPVDLRGVPRVRIDDSRGYATTAWAIPEMFPHEDKPAVLFFDELPQADDPQQKAAFQIINERRCGDYRVPDSVMIVAAGNYLSDNAGSNAMLTAMRNRFFHIAINTDIKSWIKWATLNEIDPRIIGYLRFRPSNLSVFSKLRTATGQDRTALQSYLREAYAFPTERSWEMVSDLFRQIPQGSVGELTEVAATAVGQEVAAELRGFLNHYIDLPDIEELLENPDSFDYTSIFNEPSKVWGLFSGVIDHVNVDNYDKMMPPATEIFKRLPEEYRTAAITSFTDKFPSFNRTTQFADFINDTSRVYDIGKRH